MEDRITRHPETTPLEIRIDIQRDFIIGISYYRVWKGKELTHEHIHGNCEDWYSLLPFYMVRLMEVNPLAWTCLIPEVYLYEIFLGIWTLCT